MGKRKNEPGDTPPATKKSKANSKSTTTPTPKGARTRTAAAAKKRGKNEPEPADEEEEEDPAEADIDWSDVSLSEAIVSAIISNSVIKQVLYPSPGSNASTANGGGMKKTEAQQMVAEEVFGEHPVYKEAFTKAKTPKQKEKWSLRIKNRLVKMTKIVNKIKEEMGATGAGISRADDIDMNIPSAVTNAWTKYSEIAPWFFDMRDLMGERPNLVPTGLGNSDSPIEMDIINPHTDDNDDDNNDDGNAAGGNENTKREQSFASGNASEDYDVESVLDEDEDDAGEGTEVKGDTKGTGKGKEANKTTSAQAAAKRVNPKKRKTARDEFADIAKEEERTRRQELDVARLMQEESLTRTKYEMQLKIKQEDRELEMLKVKANLKELKMKQKHERRMRRYGNPSNMAFPQVPVNRDSELIGSPYLSGQHDGLPGDSNTMDGGWNTGNMSGLYHDSTPSFNDAK
ncbi:hypothetical protein AAF712_016568 [Marasmius tenuissimus]|uniref:No apical meristem-associated C-terminal domain-containing protein n=1 Tax=Marasmius tenuissimus TaxID=585030 RepID=A0ABR2Z7A8_9AGAR